MKFNKLGLMGMLLLACVLVSGMTAQGSELGSLNGRVASYFARVMDTSAVQLTHNAQLHFAKAFLADTEYADLPIVSQMAPQKAGREDDGGPEFFIDHGPKDLTQEDLESFSFFNDKIAFLLLNGEQIMEWIEASTGNFNQIDPNKAGEQFLLNEEYRDYNFDNFEGVEYQIDVTKPQGERLVAASYQGAPLTADMDFVVVTNTYRAGGGGDFPNAAEENRIFETDKQTRMAIVDYLFAVDGEAPKPNYNWSIAPVEVAGPVLFRSSPAAAEYLNEVDVPNVSHLGSFGSWGIYSYEISSTPK